jgi:hypothetical protein
MSHERIEWMRQFAEAWNRGDIEAGQALPEAHLPLEWEFIPLYLDRVYRRGEPSKRDALKAAGLSE